ncbi:MAG: PQQ-binding-like beta-propeller repeat protein [Acidobacteriota bacterium]
MRRLSIFALVLTLGASTALAADWPRFRGPDGSGQATGGLLPADFSLSEHLDWRTELPGKGVSSPIVAGDRVYLTTYTGYGQDLEEPGDPKDLVRHLLAFDRKTGEELWRFSVAGGDADPFQGFLTQHGYATSTPVTDGERIYALFGKAGIVAVDRGGQELWRRALGSQSDPARWGDASSPVLVDGVLVVNAGVLGRKVVGLDPATGEELWSVADDKFNNSWSTPAVYRGGEKPQVLVHFPFKILGIAPETGDVVWSAATPLDDATSPSIIVEGDVAYLMGSRAGHAMAVRLGGTGDVSETHTVWRQKVRAGITTPVAVDGALYWGSGGIFMAHSLETGERVYRDRLPRKSGPTGGFPNADYSSPIAVGDRILLFTRNGENYVIEAGETFQVVAHNPPFEGDTSAFSATPAVAGDELFMRSEKYLYKISVPSPSAAPPAAPEPAAAADAD